MTRTISRKEKEKEKYANDKKIKKMKLKCHIDFIYEAQNYKLFPRLHNL